MMETQQQIPSALLWLYTLFLFFFGAVVYGVIEILWRGYTHPTMPILGGLCFLFFAFWKYTRFPFLLRFALSVASVLCLEYLAGQLLNGVLGLNIWDYSALPYSLHGQICLQYSIYWVYLTAISFLVLPILEKLCFFPYLFFGNQKNGA